MNWDSDLLTIPLQSLVREEEATPDLFPNLEAVVQNPRACYICGYALDGQSELKDVYSETKEGKKIAIRLHLYCYQTQVEGKVLDNH